VDGKTGDGRRETVDGKTGDGRREWGTETERGRETKKDQ
jgi:hypothetical protein